MDASIVDGRADLADEKVCIIEDEVTRAFDTYSLKYKLAKIDLKIKETFRNKDILLKDLPPKTTIKSIKRRIAKGYSKQNNPWPLKLIKYLVLRTENGILENDTLLRTILTNDPSPNTPILLELAKMRITIAIDGSRLSIDIDTLTPWHTFKDVKKVIEKKTGVPYCYLHCLRSVGTGEICDDDTYLLGCNQLHLTVSAVTIYLRSAKFGTTFDGLSVPVNTTVRDVKTMIKDRFKVNVERLVVVDVESGITEVHDVVNGCIRNLLSYGIKDGHTIYFSCKRECVFMFGSEPNGYVLSFELHPQEHIKDLKYELMCRSGSTHFAQPPHRPISIFMGALGGGSPLEDEDCVARYDLAAFRTRFDIAIFISGLSDIDRTLSVPYLMYCSERSN
eukprot:162732_1